MLRDVWSVLINGLSIRSAVCVCVQVWLNGQRQCEAGKCAAYVPTLGIHGRSQSGQKWAHKAITYNNYAFVKCNQWFTIRLSKCSSIASSSKRFILIIPFEMRHSNLNVNSIVYNFVFSPPLFSEATPIHAHKTSKRKTNNNEREKTMLLLALSSSNDDPKKSSAFDFPFATAPIAAVHSFIIAHKNNRKLREKMSLN